MVRGNGACTGDPGAHRSYDDAYELSLHGVGISIYPASISSLIRDKDVCVREVEHPDAHASYALIWNKNHTLSHVAEEFIAYVKEESGQQMYYA